MIAPRELLDTSLGQMRTLTAFLREQLGEGSDAPESETAEGRACAEILAYLTGLILRLEAPFPEISGALALAGHAAARMKVSEANEPFSNFDTGPDWHEPWAHLSAAESTP